MKRLTIMLEDDLYKDLLALAGGPRKVSEYLNPFLREALAAQEEAGTNALRELFAKMAKLADDEGDDEETPPGDGGDDLAAQVADLRRRVMALEQRGG